MISLNKILIFNSEIRLIVNITELLSIVYLFTM